MRRSGRVHVHVDGQVHLVIVVTVVIGIVIGPALTAVPTPVGRGTAHSVFEEEWNGLSCRAEERVELVVFLASAVGVGDGVVVWRGVGRLV